MAEVNAGTVYSMNQAIMDNMKCLSKEAKEKAKKELKAYFLANADEKYFMLLCKELSDYTIFVLSSGLKSELAANELEETLSNRGKILAVDSAEGNAYEIWVRTDEDKMCHAYYLFPYKMGIIEV